MAKQNGYASIPEEIRKEFVNMPGVINIPDAKYGEEYDYQLPMIGKYTAYGTAFGCRVRVPAGLKISMDGRITGIPMNRESYEEDINIMRFLKTPRARRNMEAMDWIHLKIRVNPDGPVYD